MKKIAALICTMSVFIGIIGVTAPMTEAYSTSDMENALKSAVAWKNSNDPITESPGSKATDYYAIALARSGVSFDTDSYIAALGNTVSDYDGYSSTSDMQRTLLTVTALHGDAQYIGGRDLVADSTYFRAASAPLGQQGILGYIGALCALDAGNYSVPDWAYTTREDMITSILAAQSQNGSFDDDVFVTANAIIALAPYNNSDVYNVTRAYNGEQTQISCGSAIYSAVEYLSSVQKDSGDFENLSETAFVSMAMDSIGLLQDDTRLKKNGTTVMDALLNFKNSDGGYPSTYGGASDGLSTSYALCALVSSLRRNADKSDFFDFTSSDKLSVSSGISISKTSTATVKPNTSTGSSSSSAKQNTSKTTPTPKVKRTSAPARTAAPKSTKNPTSSASPSVKTPNPTKKPDLVGPVQQIGPQAPTPSPLPDELTGGENDKKSNAVPIAAIILIVLAAAAFAAIVIIKKNPALFKKSVKCDNYRAKRHLKTDERRRFEQREKYKERRRYRKHR